MINFEALEKSLKNGDIKNSYVICGGDEELIKEAVKKIMNPYVQSEDDLNFSKFDGMKCTFNEIQNACETFPFMGEKKIVLVYRCNFLKEKQDSQNKALYKEIKEYLKDVPKHAILIMYYVFNDKRETAKKNKNFIGLDKLTTLVGIEKLRRDNFYMRVSNIFKENNGNINKVMVKYFAEKIPVNLDIARKEAIKLCDFANGNEITKKDIDVMIINQNEDDVFDLIECIAQKKNEKAIQVVNEILFKDDKHMLIVISIENHFKKLYDYKVYISEGKKIDDIVRITKMPRFVVEKTILQSKKFSMNQIKKALEYGLNCEMRMKMSSVDKDLEIEMLILKIALTKK